jgi:fatty acid desaturase
VASHAAAVSETQRTGSMDNDELELLTHRLVRDLHVPRPAVFWTDLLASAAIGWSSFALAVTAPLSATGMILAALSALALYRGLCFTHELTHLQRRAVPGFETAWNLLFGVPLLLPSFTYIGVHQSHHSLSSYGTKDDPEYLPFATSRRLIILFAIQSSILIPLLLLVRFLVLAPVGLVWPRLHHWLEAHASSFSMNPAYRRSVPASMARKMRRWEFATLLAWAAFLTSVVAGMLPVRTVLVWYGVLVLVSFVNTVRVLGAHDYESDGRPLDRLGQLLDSIDTPGGPWTELWAPVGLRYHALHHYFPGIPYHNLGAAYRRIIEGLPRDAVYHQSTSPSLRESLNQLYLKASSRGSAPAHDPLRDH